MEFLRVFRRRPGGLYIAHNIAGRGSGKTHVAILALLESALIVNPGRPHLWTEPTYKDCNDTFLRTWREIVPSQLYKFRKADMQLVVGPQQTEIDIRSRKIDDSTQEPFRGPTYAAAFVDEAAKDPTRKIWDLLIAAVRDPKATQKYVIATTTPRLGWYHQQVIKNDDPAVYSTTYDNIWIDPDWIERLKSEYDPQFAEQEIMARWVAQGKRAWDNADLEHYWPIGNLHRMAYQADRPYLLGVDLGVRSAWGIYQWSTDRVPNPPLVCVAEYTPDIGDTDTMCKLINDEYGKPAKICIGADYATRSQHNRLTHAQLFRTNGWDCPISDPKGIHTDKMIQYQASKRTLLDARGHRMFCISDKLVSHDNNGRGIREVLEQDVWPEPGKERTGEFLPKDKRTGVGLEDMRDAWMYTMVDQFPIQLSQGIPPAKRGAA